MKYSFSQMRWTMKIKILCFALALGIAAAANARVQSITEYTSSLPIVGSGAALETTCSEACVGYDLTTTICPAGEKMVDCEAEGCSYYHKCVAE